MDDKVLYDKDITISWYVYRNIWCWDFSYAHISRY